VNFSWYNELPGIFNFAVNAILIMIVMFMAISVVYSIPQKANKIRREINDTEKELAKKKVVLNNSMKEYIDLTERRMKENDRHAAEVEALTKEKEKLQSDIEKLAKELEKATAKIGGRPRKNP